MFERPIVLFASPLCEHCAAARAFLSEHEVEFVEVDVSDNRNAIERLVSLTGCAMVPTLIVGDVAMIGFDPDRVATLLAADPDACYSEEDLPDEGGGG